MGIKAKQNIAGYVHNICTTVSSVGSSCKDSCYHSSQGTVVNFDVEIKVVFHFLLKIIGMLYQCNKKIFQNMNIIKQKNSKTNPTYNMWCLLKFANNSESLNVPYSRARRGDPRVSSKHLKD